MANDERIMMLSILSLFCIFFGLMFQTEGIRFFLGYVLFFIFPVYYGLGIIVSDVNERAALSFFIGAGLIPTLIYYLGLFISLRLSIWIIFVVMVVGVYILRNMLKKVDVASKG